MPVQPNRIWSLNEENEIATKQVWAALLKQLGYDLDHLSFGDIEKKDNFVASKSPKALPKLEKTSVLPDLPPVSQRTQEVFETLNGSANYLGGEYDNSIKVSQKDSHPSLAKYSAPQLQQSFLGSLRNDSPDNEILRFVRARNFKVVPALEMAAACFDWKANSHQVNKWTMEGDAAWALSGKYPELTKGVEMQKTQLGGRSKKGGKCTIVSVKKHFGSDCPEKDFEMLICLCIEYVKLTFRPYTEDADGGNILFDMTGFSLKNADLNACKFLAKAFEANYPESLSNIWLHKAPWIFNAVWKIIKGWLDPVVASKVHFTKSALDLENFMTTENIPKDMGGKGDFVCKYVPPTKENSKVLPPDDKSKKLVATRTKLLLAFIDTTLAWINAKTTTESTQLLKRKIQLGGELAQNYVDLDPYIRSRGQYDRNGTMEPLSI